jgi:hypothetical protein
VAWPTTPLGTVVELYISGAWVDITTYVRRDDGFGVRITEPQFGFARRRAAPSELSFKINNIDGRFSPRNPASPYAGLIGINTPVRCTIEGEEQFWGEVSSGFPTTWTTGGHDAWVPILAQGRMRRINTDGGSGTDPLAVAVAAASPMFFWPLTDPEGSAVAAAGPGAESTVQLARSGSAPLPFSAVDGPAGSSALPDFSSQGALIAELPSIPGLDLDDGYSVLFWFRLETGDTADWDAMAAVQLDFRDSTFPAADVLIYAGVATSGLGYAQITAAPYTITSINQAPPSAASRSSDLVAVTNVIAIAQGEWHQVRVSFAQSGLGVTEMAVYVDGVVQATDTNSSGTYTLGQISRITINPTQNWLGTDSYFDTDGEGLSSLGYVSVHRNADLDDTLTYAAGLGHIGEAAGRRIERLLDEAGIGFASTGDLDDTIAMGPQRAGLPLRDWLEECAQADSGYLRDARTLLGLHYRTNASLYNQTADVALVYDGDDGLVPPLTPDEGEADIVNDIEASSVLGHMVHVEKTTGDRNVSEPGAAAGGVGRYRDHSLTYNVETLGDLADAAGWALRVGTLDAASFPEITINLLSLAEQGKTALWQAAAAAAPGDLVEITNTPIWIPDDVQQFVGGRRMLAANLEYEVTYHSTPASSWLNVGGPLEDSTYGRLDSEDSYLHLGITSGATSLRVRNESLEATPTLWTDADAPFPVRIGSEDLSVTNVTDIVGSYRSVGTASHASAGPVTPGLPAGVAVGDLMVLVAAVSRTVTSPLVGPAGWTVLVDDYDHFKVWGRLYQTGDAAPTVTIPGVVVGDSVSGQIAAFPGVQLRAIDYEFSVNASAQDIATPNFTPWRDNCLVLAIGWKADDWTSVATFTGMTEIAEPTTIIGTDQSLVWDYVVQTRRALVPAASFVVTGGASAVSKGLLLALDTNTQTFDVTRASEGSTAAAHSDGDQVRLTHPMILAR